MENNFVHWLAEELEVRDWSQRELGRQAGLSVATISQVLSEQRRPTAEFCIGIARALRLPPEYVLRRAGHLPPAMRDEPDPQIKATAEQLITIWNRLKYLDPDSLERLLNIVVTQAEMVEAAATAAKRNREEQEENSRA